MQKPLEKFSGFFVFKLSVQGNAGLSRIAALAMYKMKFLTPAKS